MLIVTIIIITLFTGLCLATWYWRLEEEGDWPSRSALSGKVHSAKASGWRRLVCRFDLLHSQMHIACLVWARPSITVGFTGKNVRRGAHSSLGRRGGSADKDNTVWSALWRGETVTVSGLDSCPHYILPCLWLRLLPLPRAPLCSPGCGESLQRPGLTQLPLPPRRLSWLIFPSWDWGPAAALLAPCTHPCHQNLHHGLAHLPWIVPFTVGTQMPHVYLAHAQGTFAELLWLWCFPPQKKVCLFVSYAKGISRTMWLLVLVGGRREELVGGKGFLAMAVLARLDMEHNLWKETSKVRDQAHQHFYWCPWVTYWISVSICVKRITIASTSQACQEFKWNNKCKALSTRCLAYGQSPINVSCCHCCYHGNDENGQPIQSTGLSF